MKERCKEYAESVDQETMWFKYLHEEKVVY